MPTESATQSESTASAPETFAAGDLVLLAYGRGTQIARVRSQKKSGALIVDRFLPSPNPRAIQWAGKAGRWTTSENPVPASKVLGLMPPTDPRAADVRSMIGDAAVAAR